eukprot:1161667-Pelagomonas_calceolata.AAC.16
MPCIYMWSWPTSVWCHDRAHGSFVSIRGSLAVCVWCAMDHDRAHGSFCAMSDGQLHFLQACKRTQ